MNQTFKLKYKVCKTATYILKATSIQTQNLMFMITCSFISYWTFSRSLIFFPILLEYQLMVITISALIKGSLKKKKKTNFHFLKTGLFPKTPFLIPPLGLCASSDAKDLSHQDCFQKNAFLPSQNALLPFFPFWDF